MRVLPTLLIGIVLLIWDWLLYISWGYIFKYNSCVIINWNNGVISEPICQITSPAPMLFITLISIGVTLIYLYKTLTKVFKDE